MKLLRADRLAELAAALAAQGYRVIAPIRQGRIVRLAEWRPGAAIETAGISANSVKDFLFPRSEIIDRYSLNGGDFVQQEVSPEAIKTVVLAVRPCDAGSVSVLDTVFNWDSNDAFYNARREACTVVSLACVRADEHCFCTSVGGSPGSTEGADAVLRAAGGGDQLIFEPLTPKGRALAEAAGGVLAEGEAAADPVAEIPRRFDLKTVTGMARQELRFSAVAGIRRGLPRVRRVRVRLSFLPLLRHAGRIHAEGKRALSELGHLRAGALHAAHERAQSALDADGALAAARDAQAELHPAAVQPHGVHGLRPLLAAVPQRARDLGDLRENRPAVQGQPRRGNAMNIYKPAVMRLLDAREEAPDVRTFRLEFLDEAARSDFFGRYRVGQFGLYGVPGAGESTFCVASPPTRQEYIECTFRRNGRVTQALQDREVGQMITFRGPYGNCFPTDSWRGKNILFVAGGIALPPVRSVIWNVLDRRSDFGAVTIVYGARTVADLVYKDELEQWGARPDVNLVLTVDPGGETPEWKGKVGFVPNLLKALPRRRRTPSRSSAARRS